MACNGCISHGTPTASHGDLHCTADGGCCVCLWQADVVERLWSYVVAGLIPLTGLLAFPQGVGP